MVQLKDILSPASWNLCPGSVLLGPMPGVEHLKFYIIAGISGDRVCVCSVMINSQINPFILKRPFLLERQIEISNKKYSFLSHTSYINCAQPLKLEASMFINTSFKHVGVLEEADLKDIQAQIIASGMLTDEEIEMFFLGFK